MSSTPAEPPASNGEIAKKKVAPGKSVSANMNDPRQPARVKKYVQPELKPEDLPIDYSSMAAIAFGVVGFMLRQKIGCLLSLVFAAQALANMRNAEVDFKQIMLALTFTIVGLMTIYFGPNAPPPASS